MLLENIMLCLLVANNGEKTCLVEDLEQGE